MPTVMEKEQAETSSAGATSTCPAKDRLKSLSPSGCPFHAEAGHEINGAGSKERETEKILIIIICKCVKILIILQPLAW